MKNKKAVVLSLFLLVALLLGGVIGCKPKEVTPTGPTGPTAPVEEVMKWRVQHSWGAAESYYFEYLADIVRDMSGGRIDMQVFADAQLFPTQESPRAMAMGTLDLVQFGPTNFLGEIPAIRLTSIPYIWESTDEMMAICYRWGFQQEISKYFEEMYGVRLLGSMPDDFSSCAWTEPFTSLADLNGRVSTMTGPNGEFYALYGVSPVSIACGDMYTSCALGVLDGLTWGGAKCMYQMGFFEVAKYMLMPYINPSLQCCWWIGVDKWNSLPDDLKSILEEAVYSNGCFMRSSYYAGEMVAQKLLVEEYGGQIVWLPEEDIQAGRQFGLDYINRWVVEHPESQPLADILLKAYRTFGRLEGEGFDMVAADKVWHNW